MVVWFKFSKNVKGLKKREAPKSWFGFFFHGEAREGTTWSPRLGEEEVTGFTSVKTYWDRGEKEDAVCT